jgi:hypothetical protein
MPVVVTVTGSVAVLPALSEMEIVAVPPETAVIVNVLPAVAALRRLAVPVAACTVATNGLLEVAVNEPV